MWNGMGAAGGVLPVLLASTTLFAANVSSAAEWNMASILPAGNFQLENAKAFTSAIADATDGEVKITVHAGGALGYKGPDLLAAVRDGLVQMADIQMNQQVGEDPFFGIESLPFLAVGFDDLQRLQKITRPHFEELVQNFNQKLLYVTPWPPQALFAPHSTTTDVSEFSDLTIRTIDKNATDFFAALGAKPVQMPWGEVMPSLASGVLNAVSTASTSAVDGQFWDFLTHHNQLQWQMNSQMVTVNLDAWNELSSEHQNAIEEIAERMEGEFWKTSVAADEDAIAKLEAHGMTTVVPSDELKVKLREIGELLWVEYVDAVGPRAKQVISEFTNSDAAAVQ